MGHKKIIMSLSTSDIERAIQELTDYQNWIQRKAGELAERLAVYGGLDARIGFSRAIYDGPRDIEVTVEPRGKNKYAIIASGEEVLFVEFGAGVRYGYGHPDAVKHGMGPGTYPIPPGKGHWDDTDGWYIPPEKGGGHTYGNPPAMAMYRAGKDLRNELTRIARDVFNGS